MCEVSMRGEKPNIFSVKCVVRAIRFTFCSYVSIIVQQFRREVINTKRTRKVNYDCMFIVRQLAENSLQNQELNFWLEKMNKFSLTNTKPFFYINSLLKGLIFNKQIC